MAYDVAAALKIFETAGECMDKLLVAHQVQRHLEGLPRKGRRAPSLNGTGATLLTGVWVPARLIYLMRNRPTGGPGMIGDSARAGRHVIGNATDADGSGPGRRHISLYRMVGPTYQHSVNVLELSLTVP